MPSALSRGVATVDDPAEVLPCLPACAAGRTD
jgi:hypothetical protein